jgi:Zinc carboxypeptidase
MTTLFWNQCWRMNGRFAVILLLWTLVSGTSSHVRQHPLGVSERLPWVPGPHPHRIYNDTTRQWSPRSSSDHRSLHSDTEEQTNILQYQLWEPYEIAETLVKWAEHYPSLLRVTTSQEAYGLPTAGGTSDCPFDDDVIGCKNRILLVQDFDAHPEGTPSSLRLPEVLWSGELHGDERVGPTAVLEAAQLLLDAAACEALPRRSLQYGKSTAEVWQQELARAHDCRHDLRDRGIDDRHRQWLARLLTTRRLVIVPTANALGYYQNRREENRIDPNRDFPYDQTDPKKCMQTIAGRTLNEIFQRHMFQLSLTFHGGMEVVGYEWGAPSYLDKTSPDDIAQHAIAAAYSRYAGGFGHTKAYDFGPYVIFPPSSLMLW